MLSEGTLLTPTYQPSNKDVILQCPTQVFRTLRSDVVSFQIDRLDCGVVLCITLKRTQLPLRCQESGLARTYSRAYNYHDFVRKAAITSRHHVILIPDYYFYDRQYDIRPGPLLLRNAITSDFRNTVQIERNSDRTIAVSGWISAEIIRSAIVIRR